MNRRTSSLLAIVLLATFAIPALGQLFPDTVKSPLPDKRSTLLTAFSDVLHTTTIDPLDRFVSKMGQLQAKFEAKGYSVTTMVSTRLNEVEPPASHPGYFTIPDFESALAGRKHGVVVTHGHAGNIGIAVEHFLSVDDVTQRFAALQPLYSVGEIGRFTPDNDPSERVIGVSKTFIANRARLAQNAIAWIYGCSTFRHFNRNTANPTDPATADITFLDPAVGAVFFVGLSDTCDSDPDAHLNFFGRMLGDTRLGGVKRNFTVKESFDQAKIDNTLLLARARSGDASVNKLRLLNHPRRLKTKVDQSLVYDYAYTDQIYPFTDGDFPGDLTAAVKGFGHAGPMTITVQFSEPMDPSWPGFNIQLDPQGVGVGAPPIDFTGTWSSTIFPNDTWTGSLTVPSDGTDIDGQATVVMRARDAFHDDDSSASADGEIDSDGDGLTNDADTRVSFAIALPDSSTRTA